MNATYYNTGDKLYVLATDNDTRMQSGKISLDSTAYTDFEICLSYNSKRGGSDFLKCYFITDNDSTWDEKKQVSCSYESLSTDGAFKTYRLKLTDCIYWKDTITEIRVDPFNATGSEGYIKYIRLIPAETKKTEKFTSVSFDAEDGIMPFVSGNANLSVVTDPTDSSNRVYRVVPNLAGTYTNMEYAMNFEAGATYTVSYDVMAGAFEGDTKTQIKTTIHTDPRFDNPSQYGKKNPDDYILSAADPASYSNSNQWRHVEHTFYRAGICLYPFDGFVPYLCQPRKRQSVGILCG